MKHHTHTIIQPTIQKTVAENLWDLSKYLHRLRLLGINPIILDPKSREWPDSLQTIKSLTQLPKRQGDFLVQVEDSQIFFDLEIVLKGLKKFQITKGQYFTQWEHCRLPVGIGVRAYDLQLVGVSEANTFRELQEYIFNNKANLDFLYDDEIYVTYANSLLDSRANAPTNCKDWTLKGFLQVAQNQGASRFIVDQKAMYIDDRGMKAAYGFESARCGDFPTYIMFDMTNKCNAKCIHCPHSVGFNGSQTSEFISTQSYKNIIDQCVGQKLDFVRITADGEPLLHPEIWKLLEYARKKGVGPIGVTTNGSALNAVNAQKLLDSDIFLIDFSLDAFSQKTFEVVRAGLSYQRTLKNVLTLIEMRNKANSDLKIMVSFVKQSENLRELEAFINYWESRADKVLIREMHTNVGVNDNASDSDKVPSRYPCPHLFRRTIADYGGDFKFCPIDWEGKSKLGPLNNKSIFQNWHDPIYHKYRLQHLNNAFSDDSICADCDDWRSTPWDIGYEKVVKELSFFDNQSDEEKREQ